MEATVVSEARIAADYGERESRAAYSVLIEIGQLLGANRSHVVLVGGSVPAILLPHATSAHVGTLDIDLELDPEALSEGQYADLVESLVSQGYERNIPGLKPFQLRRWARLDDGEAIAVVVDLLMPRESAPKKNRPSLVDGLRVQGIDGGGIALLFNTVIKIDGQMPDGRHNAVDIHVATIPALLVMKGFALTQRDKLKDAYDIWYCVRHFVGGADALAKECRRLLDVAVARQGFGLIASKFRSIDDFGPASVRRFLQGADLPSDLSPDQIQTDAYMRVSQLLALIR
jgi:hypothetical protein